MRARLEEARAQIVSGEIVVSDVDGGNDGH